MEDLEVLTLDLEDGVKSVTSSNLLLELEKLELIDFEVDERLDWIELLEFTTERDDERTELELFEKLEDELEDAEPEKLELEARELAKELLELTKEVELEDCEELEELELEGSKEEVILLF